MKKVNNYALALFLLILVSCASSPPAQPPIPKTQVSPAEPNPMTALADTAARFEAAGQVLEAVEQYQILALTALQQNPVQHEIFQSSLQHLQALVQSIQVLPASAPLVTTAGQPFASPVEVRLVVGTAAKPLAGAPLRVNYKIKKNGQLTESGTSIKTDAQGVARYALPALNAAVRSNLVIVYDIGPFLARLGALSPEDSVAVAQYEQAIAAHQVQIPYLVEPRSKTVPLTIAFAEFDERGTLLRRVDTAGTLTNLLQKSGFLAAGLQVNPSLLRASDNQVIIAAWKIQGKVTGRAVFGTGAITEVGTEAKQIRVQVTGTLKVVELATGELILQQKNSVVAVASDRTIAAGQAFRQLATQFATILTEQLP